MDPDPIRLTFAKCDFFQSVFFSSMFAYSLTSWVAISVLGTLKAYKAFGKLSEKGIEAVAIIFLLLNNFDQYKDLQYVIVNEHSLLFTFIFSSTITFPLFYNIKTTKMLMV